MRELTLLTCLATLSQGSPLASDLLSGLQHSRPNLMTGGDPVSVTVAITVLNLDVDLEGVVSAHIWLNLAWVDSRLAWNPEDYYNVTKLSVPADMIWIPDIALYNSFNVNAPNRSGMVHVVVNADGSVTYFDDKVIQFKCDDYFSNNRSLWDKFECGIKFGSWTFNGLEVDLTAGAEGINTASLGQASSLKILSASSARNEIFYECCPEPYIDVTFHFVFQRAFIVKEDGVIEWNNRMEQEP